MLKLYHLHRMRLLLTQPPSGGCVLKLFLFGLLFQFTPQPPSGGCVLKRAIRL